MDRLSRHERIIDTEYYLYGGVVDVPKIYDADSKHHSERLVKGRADAKASYGAEDAATRISVLSDEEEIWLSRLKVDE